MPRKNHFIPDRSKNPTMLLLVHKFGSINKTAKALRISPLTIFQWLHYRSSPRLDSKFAKRVGRRLLKLTGKHPEEIWPQRIDAQRIPKRPKPLTDRSCRRLISNRSGSFELDRVELCGALDSALSWLDPRERQIVIMHFGLVCRPMTFREIQPFFSVTGARLWQLERRAMRKLKRRLEVLGYA